MQRVKFFFPLVKESFTAFMEDNALKLSAALSYYIVFSLAPMLLIAFRVFFEPLAAKRLSGICCVTGFFPGDDVFKCFLPKEVQRSDPANAYAQRDRMTGVLIHVYSLK
jgi:hypothetical protein